jgi:hypothetical protein
MSDFCHSCRYIADVDGAGELTDKSQLIVIRTSLLHTCQRPQYASTVFCAKLPVWTTSLEKNLEVLADEHQVRLYVGGVLCTKAVHSRHASFFVEPGSSARMPKVRQLLLHNAHCCLRVMHACYGAGQVSLPASTESKQCSSAHMGGACSDLDATCPSHTSPCRASTWAAAS